VSGSADPSEWGYSTPAGMRVKLGELFRALNARDRKAQGGGRNAVEALGWYDEEEKALQGRHSALVPPLQGSTSYPVPAPRVPEPAFAGSGTLGLLVSRFQRSA